MKKSSIPEALLITLVFSLMARGLWINPLLEGRLVMVSLEDSPSKPLDLPRVYTPRRPSLLQEYFVRREEDDITEYAPQRIPLALVGTLRQGELIYFFRTPNSPRILRTDRDLELVSTQGNRLVFKGKKGEYLWQKQD